MEDIWNFIKSLAGASDKAPARPDYSRLPPVPRDVDPGFGQYVGKDLKTGEPKVFTRRKPPGYESEDQRKFVMATRRGAVQDPNFTPPEASEFIREIGDYAKRTK